MPEAPTCTCLTGHTGIAGIRYIRVFDPYCQIERHRGHGTYTGPEPTYPKAAGNG